MHRVVLLTAALILGLASPVVCAQLSTSILPARLAQGSPILIQVKATARLVALSGEWMGKRIYFAEENPKPGAGTGASKGFSKNSPTIWFAFAGVALDTPVGSYTLKLTGKDAKGTEVSGSEIVRVEASHYTTVELKVAKEFTQPDETTQKRIAEDQKLKHEVFERADHGPDTPLRLWQGSFVAPIPNTASDGFGTRRVFNGELQSQHQGLDFHAATGTPVHAANGGKVVLARSLFFEGNCVAIDHGEGLLTIYMHLSELKVKAGQSVQLGEVVGLSGATGRATGPHLHMGVRWQGVYLDPAQLLTLKLP